jgi:TolB-like protein/Flp pilus assembly protein TadD
LFDFELQKQTGLRLMEEHSSNSRVRFGDFEAHLATGELFLHGKSVEIQRKPFRILELLLLSNGALVTREEIINEVWPHVHVDKQHCLNTAMRKLRSALALNSATTAAIETVGSLGYRLLIPVEFISDGTAVPESSARITVAVLPFQNLSGEDDAFFSNGLTEQMIAQLGRTCRNLSVIAPISSMHYRNTSKEAPEVGRELKSEYLLCGSVLKGNQRFRITAKLIRAIDQVCIWTDSYARNDADIFLVQDDITQQIAQAIARTLPVSRQQNTNLTTRPEVYETFLRAAFYAAKGAEPAFIKAVELFQQTIAEDPNFAPAYASLAILFAEAGQYGVMPPKIIYERVDELASRALALSPVLPEARASLGFANLFYHADFAAAESDFLRAMELSSSCINAYYGYGMLMSAVGRHTEALAAMTHARDLDPFSPMSNALLATTFCLAGRLDEALNQARSTVEIEPNFPTGHACIGWTLASMGDNRAAVNAQREAVRCCPDSSLMTLHLAHSLAMAGDHAETRELLQGILHKRTLGVWVSSYWIALVNLALGDCEAALHWLGVATEECDGWRVIAAQDSRLSGLAEDPRFQRILQNIGLPTLGGDRSATAGS